MKDMISQYLADFEESSCELDVEARILLFYYLF
jgi:hypothetical protein